MISRAVPETTSKLSSVFEAVDKPHEQQQANDAQSLSLCVADEHSSSRELVVLIPLKVSLLLLPPLILPPGFCLDSWYRDQRHGNHKLVFHWLYGHSNDKLSSVGIHWESDRALSLSNTTVEGARILMSEYVRRRRHLARFWLLGYLTRVGGREPLHLLHIYKTGGTALKTALGCERLTPRYKIYLHKHSVTLTSIPRGQKFAFFVRDPVERFVSGFYGRYRQGRPTYFTPWSEAESETFARYATPNELGEALARDGEEARLARAAMASLDRMITPFTHWLGEPDYFQSRLSDVLFVGRQASLAHDFERLKAALELPIHVALPKDDIRANSGGDYDATLSAVARAAFTLWFSSDYAYMELFERLKLTERE